MSYISKLVDFASSEITLQVAEGVKIEYSTEVRSVHELYRLMKDGVIEIPSDIQRGYVWSEDIASAFIESLILGFPIPPIYLVKINGKFLVIDGVQRLKTIEKFLDNDLRLKCTLPSLKGKTFKKLDKSIQHKLLNFATIPVYVLRIQTDKDELKLLAICDIVRRINLGERRMTLTQVIMCAFPTPVVKMIREISESKTFRELMIFRDDEIKRMTDKYLILALTTSFRVSKPLNFTQGGKSKLLRTISKFIFEKDEKIIRDIRDRTIRVIELASKIGFSRKHFTLAEYGISKALNPPVNPIPFVQILYMLDQLCKNYGVERIEKLGNTIVNAVTEFYRSKANYIRNMRNEIERLGRQDVFERIYKELENYVTSKIK